jgi:hypothetical protein
MIDDNNSYITYTDYRSELKSKNADLERKESELKELKANLWPAGYDIIPDFDVYLSIARDNLDQETYEQVVKDFDEAQVALARMAKKLATIVKIKDSESLTTKISKKNNIRNYTHTNYGIYTNNIVGYSPTTYPTTVPTSNYTTGITYNIGQISNNGGLYGTSV